MEKDNKKLPESKKDKNLNLTVIISSAVGAVAVVAIVLALILGGGKKGNDNGKDNGNISDPGDGEFEGDGSGILNEDSIDPDGWTKVDK